MQRMIPVDKLARPEDHILLPFTSIRRARVIIAVSEYCKHELLRAMPLNPQRVQVIHEAAAPVFHQPLSAVERARHLAPYGWDDSACNLLTVGRLEPRKNIDTLLDAWHLLKSSLREEFDLVVAGATGWQSERTVRRLEAGIPDVRYLRYVPEQELPGLSAGATAFAAESIDALAVGLASLELGAGRSRKDDVIDPAAGLVIAAPVGARLEIGDALVIVHARSPELVERATARLRAAWTLSDRPVARPPHVLARVDRDGVARAR